MGTISWHACRGLAAAGLLEMVLATDVRAAGEIAQYARELPPGFKDVARALNRFGWQGIKDDFFDRWVASWIEPGVHFYGWMHQSLSSIRKCQKGGGRTWIDRGSVEPALQARWLAEEYKRVGLDARPMSHANLQRMLLEAAETDFIVAPSRFVADSFLAAGHRPEKLFINPLGVELPLSPRTAVEREKLQIAFVGQLSIQKGIPDLLNAWKKLKPAAAELVLAGIIPGPERKIIEPLLRDTPNVIWNGHCEHVLQLLQGCDVLVLPSAQDGFGLVVLEAFAAGIPVIVSDRVGAQDCVTHGVNGFVFPYGCLHALEERIHWFLQDANRARGMSKAASDTAMRYSWADYGKRLATIIAKSAVLRS